MELKTMYTALMLAIVITGAVATAIGTLGKFLFQTKKQCKITTDAQSADFCKEIKSIKAIIHEGNETRNEQIKKRDKFERQITFIMGKVAENLEIDMKID